MKKLKSFFFALFLLVSSTAKADGVCSCGLEYALLGVSIWYEHHEYWGNDDCSVVYGAVYSEYYFFGNQQYYDQIESGAVCSGTPSH